MDRVKRYQYKALARQVLVVAVMNDDVRDWSAYIDAVPGQLHDMEYQTVAKEGEKISKAMAVLLFPEIASRYTWRN